MKRICFVVQRYGKQVLGGSEAYCRQIAEKLTQWYDVEVLTTKALSYFTWDNEIDENHEELNGVTVHRFPTEYSRCEASKFSRFHEAAFGKHATLKSGQEWLEAQGPYSPALVDYVKHNKHYYDAFVLMTYLYYPTVMAAREVGEKSVLIPTAHDESYIYQPIFDRLFSDVAALYFLTPEEKKFVEKKFSPQGKILGSGAGGVGITIPKNISVEQFREKYHLGNKPYLVYAGRIENAKSCPELFDYFRTYKMRNNNDLQLVLCGKGEDVPCHEDIHALGFVSEEDKFSAMAGAVSLVLPSRFESLSIVLLEAMSVGTPVLVSEYCEVLKGHCVRSNAGLYYRNYLEFEAEVNYLLEHKELRDRMGECAKAYIEENYQWSTIMDGLRDIIDKVIERNLDALQAQ